MNDVLVVVVNMYRRHFLLLYVNLGIVNLSCIPSVDLDLLWSLVRMLLGLRLILLLLGCG